jgi:hypothetical protein
MADVTDLAAKIEERRRRLDQVDQALAEMRRLLQHQEREAVVTARKQKRGPRQLRLPLPIKGRGKRLRSA